MTRFGALAEKIDERRPGTDLPLLSVSQTRGVLRRSELTDSPPRAESLDAYKVCRQGDIIFNKMSIRAGAMGIAPEDGLVTYHYEVMRPRRGIDPRFVVHLMKSSWFTSEMIRRERGIGAGDQANVRTTEVPYSVLRTIDVWAPSEYEQTAIADYLDRETARIDTLIEEQQRLVETLSERRSAVIAHTLASTDARSRLKYVASIQTGITLGGEHDPSAPSWPYLRVANVQAGFISLDEIKHVRVSAREALSAMVRPGDVLMTEGGDIDKLGRAALWDGAIEGMLHQNHVFAVRPTVQLDSNFLVYWLDSPIAREYFVSTARKTTNLASTNKWTIGNVPIPLPSLAEQRRLVGQLDAAISEIDQLVSEVKRLIELSQERRAALITAAVTGQIDVRGEAA